MALKDYHNTGDTAATAFYGAYWEAQAFTTTSAYDAESVKVKIFRTGSPGTLTLSIRATAAGIPTGADLVSTTVDGDVITADTGGEYVEFVFSSGYSLTDATVYAIVLRGGSGAANRCNWRYGGDDYASGQRAYSSNSGGVWIGSSTSDHQFEVYGSSSTPVNASATLSWTVSLSGAATVITSTPASATLAWTVEISAAATIQSNWQTSNFKSIKRLIVIGNDGLWFESI